MFHLILFANYHIKMATMQDQAFAEINEFFLPILQFLNLLR